MQRISNALLSRAECLTILRRFLNVKDEFVNLIDFQLKRDNSAVGYLGDYYALTLNYCIVSLHIEIPTKLSQYCHIDFRMNLS